MAANAVVLVAAADRVVRLLVVSALRPAGFLVPQTHGSRPTAEQVMDLRPDVIVMEAEEPPDRAFDAVRELAADGGPPLLLMSPLATPTRVADGLNAGADDYIARPFDPAELRSRVRSLVRRRSGRLYAGRRSVGSTMVDLEARTVSRAGRPVRVSREEWTLLSTLLHAEGSLVWREELLTAAFGEAFRDDIAQLRLSISRLRRKLGLQPWEEGPIRTIHGLGYAYDPQGLLPRPWSGQRGLGANDPGRTRRGARLAASASGPGRR
jgi:DNA-binding response OmpR family regulator